MKLSLNSLKNSNIAAAVSGGSDSLALLYLLIESGFGENLTVLHFNHKLRKESDDEELWLKNLCEKLGVKFVSSSWVFDDFQGNVQQLARKARYAFFKNCVTQLNLSKVLIGHTQDDVVETMLMRMGRGSGLKGLAAMDGDCIVEGVPVLRPLLDCSRQSLQEYLKGMGVEYLSDPSNENDKFYRIRVRKLKDELKQAGLEYNHLYESARSLKRADDALGFYVNQSLELNMDNHLLSNEFLSSPQEVSVRVLAKALTRVTGDGLAPRTSKCLRALEAMKVGEKKFTLGGAIFTLKGNAYLIEKE